MPLSRSNVGDSALPLLTPVVPAHPAPSLRQRLSRVAALVRYHRPAQLARRAAKVVRRRVLGRGGSLILPGWPDAAPELREHAALASIARRRIEFRRTSQARAVAERFALNRLRLLNVEVDLGQPVDWRLNRVVVLSPKKGSDPFFGQRLSAAESNVDGAAAGRNASAVGDELRPAHLWRFQFHYHEFLLDLAADARASSRPDGLDRAWRFILEWIEGNPVTDPRAHDDAWHPFCISRRLAVWVALWNLAPPPAGHRDWILRSLLQQARHLARNFEWDLGGNHLLENFRGLALAAAFLAGREADGWLDRVSRLLPAELGAQVLEHGEHFERSPMYHALVLEAVLDLGDALRPASPGVADCCAQTARRMADFLESILHPDGEIPLLGDSVLGEAPDPGRLMSAARAASGATKTAASAECAAAAHRCGPYWIWKDHNGDQLLFDAGPLGADHLPAHAHCDLLNIEVSIGGRRLIVDSGTCDYEANDLRRHCRSTAAHNVVEINGQDQCDVWSRFRMGRRGRPSPLETGETDGFHWARSGHDSYRHLGAARVGRWIGCRPGGPWFIVDSVDGSGVHSVVSRLHLHPDVRVERTGAEAVTLTLGDREVRIAVFGGGRLELGTGWHSPEFGRRQACSVLECRTSGSLPIVCGWWITPATALRKARDVTCSTARIAIAWEDQRETRLPFRSGGFVVRRARGVRHTSRSGAQGGREAAGGSEPVPTDRKVPTT
jgi:uncharacterized heparinase superfamily protein